MYVTDVRIEIIILWKCIYLNKTRLLYALTVAHTISSGSINPLGRSFDRGKPVTLSEVDAWYDNSRTMNYYYRFVDELAPARTSVRLCSRLVAVRRNVAEK